MLAVVHLQVAYRLIEQQQIQQYGEVVMLQTIFIHITWMRIWLSITANVPIICVRWGVTPPKIV